MTTQPFFDEQVLQWSGESHEVEMTSPTDSWPQPLADLAIAAAITVGVVALAFVCALLASLVAHVVADVGFISVLCVFAAMTVFGWWVVKS